MRGYLIGVAVALLLDVTVCPLIVHDVVGAFVFGLATGIIFPLIGLWIEEA